MRTSIPTLSQTALLALAVAFCAPAARAAEAPATSADTPDDQVVVPQVDRRDVHRPRIPSNDFEIGLFGGGYSTQSFGTNAAYGLRVGYDITEDFFVEATLGRSRVSDKTFRQILPGGVLTSESERLQYDDLSVGWNFLPGEIFVGKNWAKASSLYVVGGVGTTRFDDERNQTWNFGLGGRLYLADWVALRADARDHVFSLDLLGRREMTNNPELTLGVSFFF